MANYIIATSSTSDLPRTWLEDHRIPFISYSYTVKDKLYEDDCREETRDAVYVGMRQGDLLKTSMINEFVYYDFFKELMDTGKDVIFLDMSQKMSVSFVNANKAAEKIRMDYPDQKLYVMDTLCISGGLGLLVEHMVERMEKGMSYDEVIAWGEENKLKIAHRFTVDDLKYLKAGGRVSNAAALVGSMLNIKPVLYVPDGGTLDVVKKARGRKAALKAILDSVLHDLSQVPDPTGLRIHILQADCRADAETVRDGILAVYPQVGEITITSLGVVIGAHCGPGLLTVFYLCNGRNPE
ncbi:MAG: DegV family protein [Oscillospiraceae bacterium]|nr:DegV family protein [Oscillospiraceae bacterium]